MHGVVQRIVARVLAKEFPSDKALKQYLQEHPQADKTKHTVKTKAYKTPTPEEVSEAKKRAKNTTWVKPDLKEEGVELERTAERLSIQEEKLLAGFHNAKLEPLDDDTWSKLENTDSFDTDTFAKADAFARKYDRDIAWTVKRFGDKLPSPIVLFRKGEPPYLIGGNTRLMASRAIGTMPKVLAIRL